LKLILDTNIYADYAEGVPRCVEFIATHGDQLFIPSVVLGELHFGFIKGEPAVKRKKTSTVINRLKVEIIEVTADVARKYATVYFSLQRKGSKIPLMMCGFQHAVWKWEVR